MSADHVAIVGAGFSGTLLAVNLLRHGGPRTTLIERAPSPARGAAYSAAAPEHLLNVRAGNMSALPDQPDHFARWLDGRGLPGGFVPRQVYGDYLADLLASASAAAPDRLRIVRAEATGAEVGGDGVRIALTGDTAITANTLVLAPGNLPPSVPGGLDADDLPPGCYVADPWRGKLAEGLDDDDTVLVLGTGLTMVDVALLLDARGFGGTIVAVSRRGLAPRAHDAAAPPPLRRDRPPATAIGLLREVRARGQAIGWRGAVDELRPMTQALWRALPPAERRRFLRHLRAWWDVHRHRIAPEVAGRLAAMQAAGRLRIVAGRLISWRAEGNGARVTFRPRGGSGEEVVRAARVVNGTGPQGDLRRVDDPLLACLRDAGLLRPDPLSIGIDVDQDARCLDSDGQASDRLLAIGPMTRGAFWEIVAVPDIRRQVWSVARRLSHAQWVEGEGL